MMETFFAVEFLDLEREDKENFFREISIKFRRHAANDKQFNSLHLLSRLKATSLNDCLVS
jgi:hypothetical protein